MRRRCAARCARVGMQKSALHIQTVGTAVQDARLTTRGGANACLRSRAQAPGSDARAATCGRCYLCVPVPVPVPSPHPGRGCVCACARAAAHPSARTCPLPCSGGRVPVLPPGTHGLRNCRPAATTTTDAPTATTTAVAPPPPATAVVLRSEDAVAASDFR